MNSFLIKILISFTLIISISSILKAQSPSNVISDIMIGGPVDAEILLNEFMNPLGKAWVTNLSGGWYNRAKPHETGGFDITLSFNYAQVPDFDQTFDLTTIGLSKFYTTQTTGIAPTITNNELSNFINMDLVNGQPYFENDIELKGFDLAKGVPLPSFNIGFGIFKNTELMARIVPQISLDDFGNINMWGVGIKHDILQWLPVADIIPLNASILFAYSKMNMNLFIPYEPTADIIEVELPIDQELQMKVSSFTTNIIISKKILFFTPYTSFGLTNGSYKLNMLGTYFLPLPNPESASSTILQDEEGFKVIDPVSIKHDLNLQSTLSVGLRLDFAIFMLYGQYTRQEYNLFTAGFGISFN